MWVMVVGREGGRTEVAWDAQLMNWRPESGVARIGRGRQAGRQTAGEDGWMDVRRVIGVVSAPGSPWAAPVRCQSGSELREGDEVHRGVRIVGTVDGFCVEQTGILVLITFARESPRLESPEGFLLIDKGLQKVGCALSRSFLSGQVPLTLPGYQFTLPNLDDGGRIVEFPSAAGPRLSGCTPLTVPT
ncbi:hypothetical protein LX32DRAFT_264498 [Colletotrichum zoysiae]|uniref:Uncharacterized protein n=1 Tax=Colletotrichum zoysiae TaxID=1216348 RepID=A0AAD9LTF6_9PEZI|nr:hypothetical protein LX32DRAFT_264498 [Colletotrichum zoysiae]